MTEMEKTRAGLEFIRGSAELRVIRERAEGLCFRLNHTPPEEKDTIRRILSELIGTMGDSCTIKPPLPLRLRRIHHPGRPLLRQLRLQIRGRRHHPLRR